MKITSPFGLSLSKPAESFDRLRTNGFSGEMYAPR